MKGDPETDPKGLIADAFAIEGITAEECRSIFLDWALSLPGEGGTGPALKVLTERFAPANPGHPMTAILREGLAGGADAPRRRGGRQARQRG